MNKWKKFLCKWLDWHSPMEYQLFDGCSYSSFCKRCKGRILQDSNGDWFRI